MSAFALSKQLKIDFNEAEKLLNLFFESFPYIKSFLDKMVNGAKETHIAKSPLDGRIRYLQNIDWDDRKKVKHALNISKNLPVQGELLDKRPSYAYI
jgi:DNA polymerase I